MAILNQRAKAGGRRTEARRWKPECGGPLSVFWRLAGLSLLVCVICFGHASKLFGADEPLPSDYQVKAAFLVNFPKYADWPAGAFAETNNFIVIAVLGETKVTEELQKIITGRIINGRKLVLKRVTSGEELGTCHILFISAAEQRRSSDMLVKLKGAGVLTVGESNDFLESGGIINMALRDRKIALEVNLTAASNARIKISSKLLSVALVKGKTN